MATRVTFIKGQTAKKVNIFENRFKIAANYQCASLPNGFFHSLDWLELAVWSMCSKASSHTEQQFLTECRHG